ALVSVRWSDRLVEVEPFKTSITLMFDRSWPFVAWALVLLAVNMVVYKAFCRYLCPLGAGMALLGRARRRDWLPRRVECGKPCQRCAHDCRYQAIERQGSIDYQECFQCLDCVAIEQSDQLCVPRINARKHSDKPFPIPIANAP
ncbi:MAG: 4Fe-4S binding protein, partial [Rhodoferax sp.]|nr:4Fe-4S binding protein [Rhodoferax sp.]